MTIQNKQNKNKLAIRSYEFTHKLQLGADTTEKGNLFHLFNG